jgi:hypothetical protein
MKKLFISLILTSIFFSGYAQENRYSLGIYAGPNRVSIVSGNSLLNEIFEPGYRSIIGLNSAINLNKRLSLQADFAYERKGVNLFEMFYIDTNTGDNTGLVTTHFMYDYITIPIMINYKFIKTKIEGRPVDFNIGLGFYNSILAKRTEMLKGENINDTVVSLVYMKPKRHDAGLSFNLGVNVLVTQNIDVNIRLLQNVGVKNINAGAFDFTEELYNLSYNLLFGVNYKFGKMRKKAKEPDLME